MKELNGRGPVILSVADTVEPTELQMKYEKAARILCAKRGHDPDEVMCAPFNGPLGTKEIEFPQWVLAADELISFSECLTSLRESSQGLQS